MSRQGALIVSSTSSPVSNSATASPACASETASMATRHAARMTPAVAEALPASAERGGSGVCIVGCRSLLFSLLALLLFGLSAGDEVRLQAVAETGYIQRRIAEKYRKNRGHLQRGNAGRYAGTDRHQDEQGIESILQGPSELDPGNDAGKAERQGQAVLDDKHDCGNHAGQNQRCLVERVVVDAGSMNALVHPRHGEHQKPGADQRDHELPGVSKTIQVLAGSQNGTDDLSVRSHRFTLSGVDADFPARGEITHAADRQPVGKGRENRDQGQQQYAKRQMIKQQLSKQPEAGASHVRFGRQKRRIKP